MKIVASAGDQLSEKDGDFLTDIEILGEGLLGYYSSLCQHVNLTDRIRGTAMLLIKGEYVHPSSKIAMTGMLDCISQTRWS